MSTFDKAFKRLTKATWDWTETGFEKVTDEVIRDVCAGIEASWCHGAGRNYGVQQFVAVTTQWYASTEFQRLAHIVRGICIA